MHSFKLIATAALLIAPAIGHAQADSAKIGNKQKAWMVANFTTVDCGLTPGTSPALTGGGTVSFDPGGDGGIGLAVATGEGGSPTITAHAINTKGTGATNGRVANQSCGTARGSSGGSAATCSVSGDEQSPTVRFNVPLAALGEDAAAKNYVGTVTIVKGPAGESTVGMYLSKKGYDYYQARTDEAAAKVGGGTVLMVVASCDTSGLTAKGGKPSGYDLAVAKGA